MFDIIVSYEMHTKQYGDNWSTQMYIAERYVRQKYIIAICKSIQL